MCPDVERRLKELKAKKKPQIHVIRGRKQAEKVLTRREVLKGLSALPLVPALPSVFGLLGTNRAAHGIEFSLLPFNWGCVNCKIGFCMCKGIPSIYNAYWYPVGFIEVNGLCQFMTSLLPFVGQVVGETIGKICNPATLAGWVQDTDFSQNVGIGGLNQQYMRVHARWYGMTPEIETIVTTYLETIEFCPCAIVDMVKNTVLGPVYKQFEKIEEKLNEIEGKVSSAIGVGKLKSMIDKVRKLTDGLGKLPLPVWFTEILSPIWLIDVLSPDNVLFGAGRSALLTSLLAGSGAVGKLALCTKLIEVFNKLGVDVAGTLDPSFVCVGFWGYGYPRIGVVRNDDPLIATLLAAARFHHLYSKTIPVIPFKFDYNNIRYQLVKPFSSECMKPGCGGFLVPNLCEFDFSDPMSLLEMIKNKAISIVGRTTMVVNRKIFLVVWKKRSKCCC